MTITPRPSLKHQLRRSASMGLPSLVLGAAAAGGAVWLGLDATGLAIFAVGDLLLVFGAFLMVVALAATVAVAEAAVRRRLRRLRRGRPRSAVQSPAITETSPVQPSAAHADDDGRGKPMIF